MAPSRRYPSEGGYVFLHTAVSVRHPEPSLVLGHRPYSTTLVESVHDLSGPQSFPEKGTLIPGPEKLRHPGRPYSSRPGDDTGLESDRSLFVQRHPLTQSRRRKTETDFRRTSLPLCPGTSGLSPYGRGTRVCLAKDPFPQVGGEKEFTGPPHLLGSLYRTHHRGLGSDTGWGWRGKGGFETSTVPTKDGWR